MAIQDVIDFVVSKAHEFGADPDSSSHKSYVLRNNTRDGASDDKKAYFGLVQAGEETTGPYHDFSLTVMPADPGKNWIVSICVGSSGFKNDFELATFPGPRRLFAKIVDDRGYCKSDFSDITTALPKEFRGRDDLQHLTQTLTTYSSVLSACQIVDDPESNEGKAMISAFIAGYARMREWPSNSNQRNAVMNALKQFQLITTIESSDEVRQLLLRRRYLVLQGPPGTGKTRTAKDVAERLEAKIFFTQFHAETSYSDFIYGIQPRIGEADLGYSERLGSLVQSLTFARDNPDVKTVLIIDEINRANLSNVLGPVFYLFEHKMDKTRVTIEVAPGLAFDRLPDNFFVIGTMNTADRSLAVVDFALRRRFAWYSLRPERIRSQDFHEDDFSKIQQIFEWYANAEELSLQPGQGYFLASDDGEMKERIRYEIYPLIREYLQEGFMRSAKEEFNNYFSTRIKKSLFE